MAWRGCCCSSLGHLNEDNARFLLLAALIILYMLCGAAVFSAIELPTEREAKEKWEERFVNFSQRHNLSRGELQDFLREYQDASVAGIRVDDIRPRWDFTGAFYFVGTVVSTIAGNVSFGMSSTPESRLLLIRRRRKRTREDMFTEIMHASGTADPKLRVWRISLSKKLDMDMESRKASNEQECVSQDEMLRIMRDEADMLRHLIELQEQKQEGRVPLQTLVDSQPASPGAESPFPKCSMRRERKVHYPFHLTQGEGTSNRRLLFTDL
ncbi:uncharacterized protein LOC142072618 [Caretta caretta]|uniref:uncharacterized protein LOC142072618 n=1 Tax=Caretta caretta TaxID=8467 RepID=UPI003D388865